jgi:hypothetical protein
MREQDNTYWIKSEICRQIFFVRRRTFDCRFLIPQGFGLNFGVSIVGYAVNIISQFQILRLYQTSVPEGNVLGRQREILNDNFPCFVVLCPVSTLTLEGLFCVFI